jgi:hypothetical protein
VHGALLIGTRHAFAPRRTEWQRELSTFEVELYCDGELVQRGGGSLVLDSPLRALRHLVELLANDGGNPPRRGHLARQLKLSARYAPVEISWSQRCVRSFCSERLLGRLTDS